MKGLIDEALGMGGKGGGKIPGSPMLAKSGSPGGLRPAKGGVGNPVRQRK